MPAVGVKAVENVWRCEMMRRFACLFLLLLMMAVPMLSVADAQYQLYAFPGRIEYVSCSSGNVYTQVQTNYPTSEPFLYTAGQGVSEVSMNGTLTAEKDYLFVLNDKFFAWRTGSTKLSALDGGEKRTIISDQFAKKNKSAMPFLVNFSDDNGVTFLVAKGDSCTLCYYDFANEQFKSLAVGNNLFAFQPYTEGQCLVVKTSERTGEKELSVLDWSTCELTSMETLPSSATSIAYDRVNDKVYYIAEGDLYAFTAAEGSSLVGSGFPRWTDQRAFVLDSGEMVTWYIDADESLLVIDLNQFN